MKRFMVFIVFSCLLLTACGVGIYSPNDLKRQDYFYKEWDIPSSLSEINLRLERYIRLCGKLPSGASLTMNQDRTFGQIVWYAPSLSDTLEYRGLVEFEQQNLGNTHIASYYYYANPDGKLADTIISIINDDTYCR